MTIAVDAFFQLLDQYGKPVSGGRVYTYAAGTLNPLATYTDQSGTVPNPNPVILDGAGRAQIWLTANVPYKLVGTDSTGVAIPNATTDNYYAGASPEQLVIAGIVPSTGGSYTGLVNLNGGAIFGGTAAQDLATLDSLGVSSVQNANLAFNSDFAINQRAAGSTADGVYGFDRTVNLCDTGSTTLSQLAQPEDGSAFAMRILQPDASAKRIGFCQIIESKDCISYRGKSLVFSVRVRSSAAVTIRAALVAWTGTQDIPTRDVVNNWASTTYTASNFFVANTTTIATAGSAVGAGTWTDVTISSASAGGVVAPSTMNNLYLVVWTDSAVAQNVTLDATRVRCGLGTSVQLWTPPNAALELTKCRRYHFRNTTTTQSLVATGLAFSTTAATYTVHFPTGMRTNPTLSSTNLFPTNGAGGTIAPTGSSVGAGTDSVLVQINVAAGLTVGQASVLYAGNGTGGFIAFDAELGV